MSAARLDRISKRHSNVPGPSKLKANHRRPRKPFDPPPPSPLDLPSIRRAEHKSRSEYNTHNPFDRKIPLHDVTGQPLRQPRKLIRCPSGGVIRAHVLYPTPEEFSKMHAVKPANRFGRVGYGGNPQSAPSSQSASSPSSPAAPPCSLADVASLVDQLKAKGLEPEDEIMLAHLNQIDMHGQSREYYHNAAEACERAKDLHAIHLKMVRYLGAMETGGLSERDYEALKLELKQRREEEERLKAEEEAKRRAEEERVQAEREAKRREEERLRAEEEAKQQERLRQKALLEKRWRARDEEYRLFMQRTWDEEDRRRAKEEELRRMEEEEQQRKLWEAQQVLLEEQRRREEELRLYNEAIERERRNEELVRRWTEMRQQRAWQEQVERQNREYAERIRLAHEFAEQGRRAAQEEAVARYQAEAVASYETLWKAFKAKEYPPHSFSYASFPLPVFDNTLKPRPDAITPEAVAEFVLSPLRTEAGLKSRKQRINTEQLLWHPDKFKTDILSLVLEEDREDMQLAADRIIRILNIMLEKEA